MTDLIVTLVGADRPGLVDGIAQAIVSHGGNWLESRMAHLAGKFAGILRVEVPAGRAPALSQALTDLTELGLRIVVEASTAGGEVMPSRAMEMDLLGMDRPGLVHQVSHLLAGLGVNVEELTTDRTSAPMSGEMLFRARARVLVPTNVDVAAMRTTLERLAHDLMVDIRLADLGTAPTS
jgi:glycine cleavage system regulatory protein